MVDILTADSGLQAVRASIRGDGTAGVTEHCATFPKQGADGLFHIQDTDTPYICVTNTGRELVTWDGESRLSELLLTRRIVGIMHTTRPTYETDADLKDVMVAVYAATTGTAMIAALKALGVRLVRVVEGLADGLGPLPQAAFYWDIHLVVPGSGVMRG